MSTHMLSSAAQLSDPDLVARVKHLAQREREATAVLVAHLAVLDERRLYLAEGSSSLFTYCTQVLHLSEHAAYGRIEAARAARKFPVILELLSDGSVNLTTVGLLAPHLTAENHRELVDEARHKSKRQVEELVARLRPQPLVPSSIRRLPTLSPAPESRPVPKAETSAAGGVQPFDSAPTAGDTLAADGAAGLNPGNLPPLASSPPPARRAIVEPLAPQQYRVQFTANAETYEKLRMAQDLLRHQIPDGDVGQVIDQALTALLKNLAKQKCAASDRPRETDRSHGSVRERGEGSRSATAHARHIPAEVRRTVWIRDGGRCAFVAHNGRRCTERGFLEFHHVVPYSAGGEATVDNIQLRCRSHNGYEAELYYARRMPGVRETFPPYWDPNDLLGDLGVSAVMAGGGDAPNSVRTELGSPGSAPPN